METWTEDKIRSKSYGKFQDLYWFWFHMHKEGRKNYPRLEEQFNTLLDIYKISVMAGKWKGQTRSEFDKNYRRVEDIIEKSNGDKNKAISLARTQANRITNENKCINRAMAAKEMKHDHIFDVFFGRAYELGAVSTQDFREYQLEKLGI